MDARFHLNRWRTTGVQPRGAQVRRVTGSSETPDSSQKTMTALRRRAFLPDPRPVALHPPLDGLLVTLDGPAGGTLQPPAQPTAQQLPHVPGMVGDPGHLLDHRSDALKGPVVGVEAMRPGALSERLADCLKLSIGQARGVAGRASAAQRLRPTRAPAPMPAADVLPRDTELVGDLGLGAAGGEQLAGLQTDTFEGLAVTQTAGVAAVGGWSHAAMLPGQPRSCHRKGRTSLVLQPEIVIVMAVGRLAVGSGRHERGPAGGVATRTSATGGRYQPRGRRPRWRTDAGSRCRSARSLLGVPDAGRVR